MAQFDFQQGSCGGKKEVEANRQPIERHGGWVGHPASHDHDGQQNHFLPLPPPPLGQIPHHQQLYITHQKQYEI